MPNRLKLCACALLPLDLVVILVRASVLAPMHALARMGSAAAATPVLPIVETVSNDESVLADAKPRRTPLLWKIPSFGIPVLSRATSVMQPPDTVSDQYFASSGICCVRQLETFDTFVSDSDNTFLDVSNQFSRDVYVRSSRPRLCSNPLR
jgi:hypothetical protein